MLVVRPAAPVSPGAAFVHRSWRGTYARPPTAARSPIPMAVQQTCRYRSHMSASSLEARVVRSADGRRGVSVVAAGVRAARGDARAAPGTRVRPVEPRSGRHHRPRQQGHAVSTVADQGRTRVGRVRRGHPARGRRPGHRNPARRSVETRRVDLRPRQHPRAHHSRGVGGDISEHRARRHDAGAVPRPAEGAHVATSSRGPSAAARSRHRPSRRTCGTYCPAISSTARC